jgi:Heterokaryon incompatibility protein (HET)
LVLTFVVLGFSNVELPQWRLDEAASEEDLQPALIEHAHAVLHVAGNPTAPALEVDMPRHEPEPVVHKLYQKHRIAAPGHTIRVLALLPGEGPTLKATMFCVDLSSGPIFEALSYVWGAMEADASYFLNIDGTIMEITPNLYHALQALRLRQGPRVLWVDAVCINQNDNRDKETQICMMEEIYRSANHVAIYLGEPATVSVTLFSFLNRDVHEEDPAEKAVEGLGQDESDIRQLLEAFIHFCHLPWWNRIWVQQEYSLAQTNPTFHLGHSSIHVSALLRDWRMLSGKIATHLVPFAGDFKLDLDVQMSWQPIMRQIHHVYGVLTLRSAHNRSDFPHPWLPRGVLKKINLRCTNPRDRIYGMRSILDPVAQAVFTPNYSEPVGTAFRKLATWILAIDGWQQVFWWYPYRLSANMPSWVPDFTKPIPEAAFLEYNLFDYGRLRKSSPCPLAIRGGVLAMEGYLLDSVNHVYAINQPNWPSTIRELWFLENVFAATPSAALLRKAPPVFKALPMLHTRALVRKWISPIIKRDMESIVFELPPFNIFEKGDILKSAFDPFFNEIKDAFRSHMSTCESLAEQSRGLSREITLTTLQARIPIYFQIHEHLSIASAFMQICTRLTTLDLFLQESNHSATDLFGAALFDYPNLLDQVEHLRKSSLPCQYTESQISVVSAKLRNLKGSAKNGSATDWIPSNESGVAAQIQPCYELLQHHITACEHEEEVRMRVRLILSYVNNIRAFPDSAKTRSSTTHDSYHQYRDQQIVDRDALMKTIAEDNGRQETLRQMICDESRQYFESVAAQFADDEDISAMLAPYQTVHEERQATSETLKITTETATAKLEDVKPDILANNMYHHNEKAFHRESYEHATWLSGRTFFSTEFGLVGMGCQGISDIRVGDKVVVLKNTEFPMVVREMEDKGYHEIVGYAIMRGFAYEEFEKLGRFEKPLRHAFYFR